MKINQSTKNIEISIKIYKEMMNLIKKYENDQENELNLFWDEYLGENDSVLESQTIIQIIDQLRILQLELNRRKNAWTE
jgi:hypothetical protein